MMNLAYGCLAECSNNFQSSYTVGVTWTVGLSAGVNIADVIEAGVNAEISTSQETGTAQSGEKACPVEDYQCALLITPTVVHVKGMKQRMNGGCQKLGNPLPYEVEIPVKSQDKMPKVGIDVCACPDLPGSAGKGRPAKCPAPCLA